MAHRVLIVEDSQAQSALIASIVEQAGYKPIVYNDITTGIGQILTRETPDIVLLDLNLVTPQGVQMADGFQVCRQIKRQCPNVPVIIVTSEGEDEACEWAFLQGADAFFQKPFSPTELTKLILEQINRKATI